MFKSIAMISAAIATSASIAAAAADTNVAIETSAASAYELSADQRELFTEYFVCSETASIRLMSEDEAAPCILLYTEVKLTFVPDVDLITFLEMPPMERHEVNMVGYAGYVEWRDANPELVDELTDAARSRMAD